MSRKARLSLVIGLGVAIVAYILVRPLFARSLWIIIWEFVIALPVIALVLWLALKPSLPRRRERAPEWRRHAQKIRELPDPEAARLRAPLEAWVADGARAEEAEDVLARASGADERTRARLREEMRAASSKRRRLALLKNHARSTNAENQPGA